MNITENNTYEMTNVISYRGKVTQQQLSVIMNEIKYYHTGKRCF